ncbi:hypothetical protein NDU88_006471 [Pleurodeles waltl]|uniref:Integrase catalytic domain-containing protein n=1 Tax=Pleurodeles waltl TaxID=8319 RepID=A0AAV7TXC5_PLEWA|nr:hypothetical protein NDU88_006471 [Pleurodeles waltl]
MAGEEVALPPVPLKETTEPTSHLGLRSFEWSLRRYGRFEPAKDARQGSETTGSTGNAASWKGIASDNDTHFVSNIFSHFTTLGIMRKLSSAYHPESSGIVERLKGLLKNKISKLCDIEKEMAILSPSGTVGLEKHPRKGQEYLEGNFSPPRAGRSLKEKTGSEKSRQLRAQDPLSKDAQNRKHRLNGCGRYL